MGSKDAKQMELGSRKQLLFDDLFLEESNGVSLIAEKAFQDPDPILTADQPWEEFGGNVIPTGAYTAVITLANGDDVSFEVVSMITELTDQDGKYEMRLPAGAWNIGFNDVHDRSGSDVYTEIVEVTNATIQLTFEECFDHATVEVPSGEEEF